NPKCRFVLYYQKSRFCSTHAGNGCVRNALGIAESPQPGIRLHETSSERRILRIKLNRFFAIANGCLKLPQTALDQRSQGKELNLMRRGRRNTRYFLLVPSVVVQPMIIVSSKSKACFFAIWLEPQRCLRSVFRGSELLR